MTEPVVKVFIMEIHLRGGDKGRSTAPNFANESRDIGPTGSRDPPKNQVSGGGLETVEKPSEETSMWRSVPRTREEIQKFSTEPSYIKKKPNYIVPFPRLSSKIIILGGTSPRAVVLAESC
jgi:hypothetical protein